MGEDCPTSQGVQDGEDLERLVGLLERSKERVAIPNLPFWKRSFLGCLITSLNDKLIESHHGDLKLLVSMDYYAGFDGGSSNVSDFSKIGIEKILDRYYNALRKKGTGVLGQSANGSVCFRSVLSSIAASTYLGLITTDAVGGLIPKARSANDLKAIVMIDYFYSRLVPPIAEGTLNDGMSPHQAFVQLLRQREFEKGLAGYRDSLYRVAMMDMESVRICERPVEAKGAKALLAMISEIPGIRKVYSKYWNKKPYRGVVMELYDVASGMMARVDAYIKRNTAGLAERLKKPFERSDDPERDLRRTEEGMQAAKEAKENYNAFRMNSSFLDPIIREADARRKYLLRVIVAKKGIDELYDRVHEYAAELGV